MATRLVLRVLGATLAPYSSGGVGSNGITAPVFVNGGISEDWHLDSAQLQRGVDTTAAQQGIYPNALSSVVIKYVDANHFITKVVYVTLSAGDVDDLVNS